MAKDAPIKVLILVVNSNKADFARELLNNLGACGLWSFLGRGVGHGGLMDVLGLNNTEKTVFFGVVPAKVSTQILTTLCKDLDLYKNNTGMALTIPLGAISRDTLNIFLEVKKQNEQELKELTKEQKQEVVTEKIEEKEAEK